MNWKLEALLSDIEKACQEVRKDQALPKKYYPMPSPKPLSQAEALLKGEAFPSEPCILEAPDGSRAKVWVEHCEWTPNKGGEVRLMLRVHDQELT